MSKVIWKFPLHPSKDDRGLCEIEMPGGAEVLTVSGQTGEPCLWALVELDAEGDPLPKRKRVFCVVGTGYEGPNDLTAENYVGTFFTTFFTPTELVGMALGLPPVLVYHVFDLGCA